MLKKQNCIKVDLLEEGKFLQMCYNNSSMPWNPLRWPNSFTTYLKASFNLEQLIIKTMFTFYQTKSENMFKVQSKHCFHCMSLNWLFKVPFPKVVFYDGAGLEESPFHKWLEFLNWSLWVNGRIDKIIPWKNTLKYMNVSWWVK